MFSLELADPAWNLLAREVAMIMLNPRHPAVRAAGLPLRPRPARIATILGDLTHLRVLARWAHAAGLPSRLPDWRDSDLRRFLRYRQDNAGVSSVKGQVGLLKFLHHATNLLSGGGFQVDPWQGRTTRQVAGDTTSPDVVTTPVIPPEQWFPLVRAAWGYVHDFAPDILRGQARYTALLASARDDISDLPATFTACLSASGSRVPVRDQTGNPEAIWPLLTLRIGFHPRHTRTMFGTHSVGGRQRRAAITALVADGTRTDSGLIDNPALTPRRDRPPAPWIRGVDARALGTQVRALRNACFVLVLALSMMRDGEASEISRGSVVEYYGTPAIVSTKLKHDPAEPRKHWWIIDPVAEAIAVCEQLPSDSDYVFGPVAGRVGHDAIRGSVMIDNFIATVNAHTGISGLPPIPAGTVRSHMFRRTMAMLTEQFAGSEIALGIQLKHVAARALANRSTQGYGAADPAWSHHLDRALDAARFRRLEDLYRAHTDGKPVGFGPAAERLTELFDKIHDTVAARNGDASVARALLRQARVSLRFGTLNHCAFDENNPAGALCLERAAIPDGHAGPLHDRCRPDRCTNSIITPDHLPIWRTERQTLLTLLESPKLAPCRKAALQRELGDVDHVLSTAQQESP
ncbi:integrase [Amycolatopsis sp. WAC 01375]|uniref:integrase n=1 Tax=Amycolatopsis sp. WAC 01375 TaxID=2203194 RepID=UPI000F7865E2|nr:integrase [Amycolatopsis sp. WAC 01375]